MNKQHFLLMRLTMTPIKVKTQLDLNALPDWCCGNVERLVRDHGGEAVYGWRVDDVDYYWWDLYHHVVWRTPQGELIDTTPFLRYGELQLPLEIDFIPDPDAKWQRTVIDEETIFHPKPTRHIPCVQDKDVEEGCRLADFANEVMDKDKDLDRADYYWSKADRLWNRFLHKRGERMRLLPPSYTTWMQTRNRTWNPPT